ncbi:MAG TPA: hypothetical protein VNL18_10455 [Gemmatimonadales bacterium]|nr:hypothetical protein [Gemmatimonadales bacterium]
MSERPRVTIRFVIRVATLFAGMAFVSALGLQHTDHIPALVVLAPGYAVQSWLFVRDLALGGLGYRLTMIGVSALFWTLLLFGSWRGLVCVARKLKRLDKRAADRAV